MSQWFCLLSASYHATHFSAELRPWTLQTSGSPSLITLSLLCVYQSFKALLADTEEIHLSLWPLWLSPLTTHLSYCTGTRTAFISIWRCCTDCYASAFSSNFQIYPTFICHLCSYHQLALNQRSQPWHWRWWHSGPKHLVLNWSWWEPLLLQF